MICWVLAMEILQGVSKQHLRPRAVLGYGVKILLSPPNYVTRSPGIYYSDWPDQPHFYTKTKITATLVVTFSPVWRCVLVASQYQFLEPCFRSQFWCFGFYYLRIFPSVYYHRTLSVIDPQQRHQSFETTDLAKKKTKVNLMNSNKLSKNTSKWVTSYHR